MQVHTIFESQSQGLPLEHPLLDRVRKCSANPEAAVDFFAQLFWPAPEYRMAHDAYCHPYMAEVHSRLEAEAAARQDNAPGATEGSGKWNIEFTTV